MSVFSSEQIIEYYEQCEQDYRFLWDLNNSRAMHYGLWDSGIRSLSGALARQNEVMARRAGISTQDHVLDAGCGVGGSALFLARRFDCHVTGISLSPGQIERAREFALREELQNNIDFRVADYCQTGLPDACMDVIWAIESVCHAPDKAKFAREAFRVLRPGGRLIIMDGFRSTTKIDSNAGKLMRSWLNGWAVNDLEEVGTFREKLRAAGFDQLDFEDYTRHVLPSARRLYWMSFPGIFFGGMARVLGFRNRIQAANARAARDQFRAIRRGLWKYGLVFATKPGERTP